MDNFEKYRVLCRLNTIISILSVIAALIFVPYSIRINGGVAIGLFVFFAAIFLLTLIADQWYLDPELEPLLKNMPDKRLWEILSGHICKYAHKCSYYSEESKGCNNWKVRFESMDKAFCGKYKELSSTRTQMEVTKDVY
jgi:hypothetical protein